MLEETAQVCFGPKELPQAAEVKIEKLMEGRTERRACASKTFYSTWIKRLSYLPDKVRISVKCYFINLFWGAIGALSVFALFITPTAWSCLPWY